MLANTTGIIVNGNNIADNISTDSFHENFNTCFDIKFSEIEDNWKTYRGLTVSGGRITLRPRTKVNIRSFIQWARGEKKDEYPRLTLFPLAEVYELIKRFNTHKQLLEDTENIKNNSIPNNFTENMEWMDWKVTLIKFNKYLPGNNGLPLNYVIIYNIAAIFRNQHELY